MWQSRVEIEDYSTVYFDCIAVFNAPLSLRAGLTCAS